MRLPWNKAEFVAVSSYARLKSILDGSSQQAYSLGGGVDLCQFSREFTEIVLKKNFNELIPIDNDTVIRDSSISGREYWLFLQDVANNHFNAPVNPGKWLQSELNDQQSHLSLTWDEANWFCAWLSTQTGLSPDNAVYDYRLPTEVEWRQILKKYRLAPHGKGQQLIPTTEAILLNGDLQAFTQSTKTAGDLLYVVRERIHMRYANLINYLVNNRWEEADKETEKVMLEIVGWQESDWLESDWLDVENIRNFSCKDLQLIDQLWLKFSGGRFGFSIQKEIYLDAGGVADFQHYETAAIGFGVAVGWRENGVWTYNLRLDGSGPKGHLPFCEWNGLFRASRKTAIFSRAHICGL